MSQTISATIPSRSSGILLHPTSLPSPFGIGDLGENAYRWVDTLAQARQTWWQVLPLSPTGYADSPYQALSAFAGNPNLISPAELVKDGLLQPADLEGVSFPDNFVDFESGAVIGFKTRLFEQAWQNFRSGRAPALQPLLAEFIEGEQAWLDDFALFMALKDAHQEKSWQEWEPEYRLRQPEALERARREFADLIGQHKFRQFLFARQWSSLKQYANQQGLRLIGDTPIFISADSSDVWSHPEYFLLDQNRRPLAVAGVPPDYFSQTGQLWGNPLYDWKALRQDGYSWWVARLQANLKQVDVVRIDHFRGFEAYWEVPANMPTAEHGRWVKGPGYDLFDTLLQKLGQLPIIAEDLGVITPEVEALRLHYGFPGMRILQFAFAGAVEERFLPHNYDHNTVVYTGTHDNDTTLGWFRSATPAEHAHLAKYLGHELNLPSWELIRLAWSSVAVLAVAPLQDVLSLGSDARMNTPGLPSGWWRWRFRWDQLNQGLLDQLREITQLYDRE